MGCRPEATGRTERQGRGPRALEQSAEGAKTSCAPPGARKPHQPGARLERSIGDNTGLIELGEAEGDQAIVAEAEAALMCSRTRLPATRSRRCFQARPTPMMPFSKSTPAPAAPRARTGPECCCACTSAGRSSMVIRPMSRRARGRGSGRKIGHPQRSRGNNAYGWLKTKSGVHRLVRISPFRLQCPPPHLFASVWVFPVVDDTIDDRDSMISDVRIDTYRSSGAGGQHVNTTDSAVRITHVPTGIVVACQSERSQHKNRATAWMMLQARLYEMELQKKQEKLDAANAQKIRYRLGPPDPVLRAAALSAGEGSPHRCPEHQSRRRAGWRHRHFINASLSQRIHGGTAKNVADLD